jgi:flagellar biosynthesis protein FlhB
VADASDRDQQTEAPTQKRRDDAVRDGDVLQSRELGTALVMIAGAAWLIIVGPWFAASCLAILKEGLVLDHQDLAAFAPGEALFRLVGLALAPVASLFVLCLVASVAGPLILGSSGFRASGFAFKASRINPATGLKRIFGIQGLIELAKALAKATVLGWGGYWLVAREMPMIMGLGSGEIETAAGAVGTTLAWAVAWLSLALFLIAGIDVPIQWLRRNARLRMTKQQIKEEMRQSDGAPELKQAVRQRQHEMLNGSARRAVAEAQVVLTNPTHFAIALRYRPGEDFAPFVVARGRGETAQAIKALARENNVPTLEYPRLTRALYYTTRAGQPIAEDLYLAVATILAFVFNIEHALAEHITPPEIDVPPDKYFDENGERSRS